MATTAHRRYSWAGLAAGPGAWAIGTQVKYSYASLACNSHAWIVTLGITLVSLIPAVLGAFLSWRAWQAFRHAERQVPPDDKDAREFLAAVSIMVALLFAVAILMQGAAGLVFHGCEL
ncbi:MAG TPA: hypothetical protein VIL69_08895 [Roseomonas sp.]